MKIYIDIDFLETHCLLYIEKPPKSRETEGHANHILFFRGMLPQSYNKTYNHVIVEMREYMSEDGFNFRTNKDNLFRAYHWISIERFEKELSRAKIRFQKEMNAYNKIWSKYDHERFLCFQKMKGFSKSDMEPLPLFEEFLEQNGLDKKYKDIPMMPMPKDVVKYIFDNISDYEKHFVTPPEVILAVTK